MTTRSIGAEMIMRERQRQLAAPPQGEGWTPEHDDEHRAGGTCPGCRLLRRWPAYGMSSPGGADERLTAIQKVLVSLWPVTWALKWWKPKDRESNLVRAGAFCAAELDRLLRQGTKEGKLKAGRTSSRGRIQ